LNLVIKKEIRQPISKTNILKNFELTKQDKIKDLASIYYSEELSDQKIQRILDRLDFEMINIT